MTRTIATSRRITPRLPVLGGLLLFLVFYAWPLVNLVGTSLGWGEISGSGYAKIICEPVYLQVIENTIIISLIVTICCLAMGYPYAKLLSNLRCNRRRAALIIALMPIFVNPLAIICAWRILLERYGLINRFLISMDVIRSPFDLCYNLFSVTVVMSYLLSPFVVLSCYAAISNLDPTLSAAARNLGARPMQAFFRIELPLCLPAIVTGGLLVFVLALGYFVVPALLGGSSQIMISMIIAKQMNVLFNWQLAGSLSVFLLSFVLVLLVLGTTFLKLWSRKQTINRIV